MDYFSAEELSAIDSLWTNPKASSNDRKFLNQTLTVIQQTIDEEVRFMV